MSAFDPSRPAAPALRQVVLFLIGVAGLAAGITLVFLGMRAVMDIGGACADGGPYVPRQSCPDGVALAMLLGVFGGMAAAALTAAAGVRLGSAWAGVALLGWPALFGALGWNFLEYGLDPPGDETGWVWGWLICGVVFWAMAAGPVFFGMWSGTGGQVSGRTLARARVRARDRTSGRTAEIAVFPLLGAVPEFSVGLPPSGIDEEGAPGDEGLVDALERLAALRERGDLNAEEYAAAKRRLLDDEAPG